MAVRDENGSRVSAIKINFLNEKNYLLEIAAFSLEGAIAAARAGAHRIELCDNAADGGHPSHGMLVKLVNDYRFLYFQLSGRGAEILFIQKQNLHASKKMYYSKQLGFEGIVVGF
ncbi:MAG: hypothetical protein IPF62_05215 [Bacteroidetes bacterium]|nr:hypothetical protein [Bacteroidota bacterium]